MLVVSVVLVVAAILLVTLLAASYILGYRRAAREMDDPQVEKQAGRARRSTTPPTRLRRSGSIVIDERAPDGLAPSVLRAVLDTAAVEQAQRQQPVSPLSVLPLPQPSAAADAAASPPRRRRSSDSTRSRDDFDLVMDRRRNARKVHDLPVPVGARASLLTASKREPRSRNASQRRASRPRRSTTPPPKFVGSSSARAAASVARKDSGSTPVTKPLPSVPSHPTRSRSGSAPGRRKRSPSVRSTRDEALRALLVSDSQVQDALVQACLLHREHDAALASVLVEVYERRRAGLSIVRAIAKHHVRLNCAECEHLADLTVAPDAFFVRAVLAYARLAGGKTLLADALEEPLLALVRASEPDQLAFARDVLTSVVLALQTIPHPLRRLAAALHAEIVGVGLEAALGRRTVAALLLTYLIAPALSTPSQQDELLPSGASFSADAQSMTRNVACVLRALSRNEAVPDSVGAVQPQLEALRQEVQPGVEAALATLTRAAHHRSNKVNQKHVVSGTRSAEAVHRLRQLLPAREIEELLQLRSPATAVQWRRAVAPDEVPSPRSSPRPAQTLSA